MRACFVTEGVGMLRQVAYFHGVIFTNNMCLDMIVVPSTPIYSWVAVVQLDRHLCLITAQGPTYGLLMAHSSSVGLSDGPCFSRQLAY